MMISKNSKKGKNLRKFSKIFATGVAVMASSVLLATTVSAQVGQLNGNNVRVRTAPSLDSDILFQVNRGEQVEILEESGDFYRVNVSGNYDVYIAKEYISLVQDVIATVESYENSYESTENTYEETVYYEVVSEENASSSNIYEILSYAKTLIGVPYRTGGSDRGGFDCSGFVTYVMRNFGVALQRSSASMASSNGFYVERGSLTAGDLVFFATGSGSRVSHVGIYVGDNQFIHSESGRGVRISGLSENYWNRNYVKANRVL
ncbi:MAG: C40 family peptidase [Firmicutes bacterium]|nr:C40 family peptidase [Bacillota bacterium]